MAILIKQIPNMKAPLESIEREIHILGINIVDSTKEIFIPYEIKCHKDGIDVSLDMNRYAKPFHIHNGMMMYVRDNNFQPIEDPVYTEMKTRFEAGHPEFITNPEFITFDETPDVEPNLPNPDYVSQEILDATEKYQLIPGYFYLISLFTRHPELIWVFLEAYIMENWNDGWFDNR